MDKKRRERKAMSGTISYYTQYIDTYHEHDAVRPVKRNEYMCLEKAYTYITSIQ